MKRRTFTKLLSYISVGLLLNPLELQAKTYLTVEQAKKILWGDADMTSVDVVLTKEQMQSIKKSSKTRVRNSVLKTWKVSDQGWFILDQIIGKHENIDMAIALNTDGTVKGLEVLVYRETYGHEVRNEKWRAQFHGKDHTEVLKLDKQIKNISGATLSCRHITDGINRITHTWDQVLRNL
jgi:Na+-translocating ferredoxin:NAD+ oxidoreductase RnfG subunit